MENDGVILKDLFFIFLEYEIYLLFSISNFIIGYSVSEKEDFDSEKFFTFKLVD